MPESIPPTAEGSTTTARLGVYIRELANALALRDWTISLYSERADPGHAAEISLVWGRKHANLRLGEMWEQMSPEERRLAILHELIELHHAQARYVASQGLKRGFHGVYAQAIEHTIDGLADALAPCFKLPPA